MELDNTQARGPRHRFVQQVILTVLVLLMIGFAILNSVRFFTRIDLTESGAYTISDVSRSLFEEIPEEVRITYYVSERLQERFPQPQEITDLLAEYAASSRGAISLAVENPGAQDSAADAEALGIVPQQLQVAEEGEQTLAVVYSGVVVSYLDRYESLPFVFSTATLEYEVTSTIRNLVADRTKALRVLVGYPNRSLEGNYSFVASQLAGAYDVMPHSAGEPVPDDVDLLLVIGAEMLDPDSLALVDDYLERRGSVLMALESVEVDIDSGLNAAPAGEAPVFDYLAELGVRVGTDLVLDEVYNQIVVQESGRGFNVQRVLPYPHWVSVLEQYTSAEHPVTSRFTGLDLYWPTFLEVDDAAGEIIVASTDSAWRMPLPFRTNPQDSMLFRLSSDTTTGQYGFVATVSPRSSGSDSAGSPGINREGDGTQPQASSGRLMVVADADFLDNRLIQATGSGHNLEFVAASAQWLANDEDLLEIRTRAARDLRLNAIEDPAQKRSFVVFAQVLNIYVVPAIVVLVGVLRFVRRRRKAAR